MSGYLSGSVSLFLYVVLLAALAIWALLDVLLALLESLVNWLFSYIDEDITDEW